MSDELEVQVFQNTNARDLPLPAYATDRSAGLDLRAAVPADAPFTLAAGKHAFVPTGLSIALPPDCEAQVRPRSGLALKHGIGVLNSPGTIDEDYRGEIGVILFNFSDRNFVINRGDRIAQLVVQRVLRPRWIPTDRLPDSTRGAGGFGHTGHE